VHRGCGLLTSQPQIQRIKINQAIAEGLEHILDHQSGTIESLGLRELSLFATTKAVHQTGKAKVTKTKGAAAQ